jgi:uncharacterized protein involved in outer membrane biogenesis
MEIAGLNVGNYVVGKLFGDEDVKINCAAADVGIKDGLATTRCSSSIPRTRSSTSTARPTSPASSWT